MVKCSHLFVLVFRFGSFWDSIFLLLFCYVLRYRFGHSSSFDPFCGCLVCIRFTNSPIHQPFVLTKNVHTDSICTKALINALKLFYFHSQSHFSHTLRSKLTTLNVCKPQPMQYTTSMRTIDL